MKLISVQTRYAIAAGASLVVLGGCSASGSQSPILPAGPAQQSAQTDMPARVQTRDDASGYLYVSNRTPQGDSQLIVYRLGSPKDPPLRTITQNLTDIAGLAVDRTGSVYVANGNAGNVLEFAPGGTNLVRTFTQGLRDPVDVAVAHGTLYVTDRGNAANGYAQQIIEYATATGNVSSIAAITGLGGYQSQLNTAIAVDPMVAHERFFASASSMTAIPPAGCDGSSFTVAENIFPTLWVNLSLSHNRQVSGVAFDSRGNMYASDACANDVAVYAYEHYSWIYRRMLPGTFSAPFFVTTTDKYVVVPSAAAAKSSHPGYVTVIDLTKSAPAQTYNSGLTHPIGAGVGPPS